MEIIQEFCVNKDESRFLERCLSAGIEHGILQQTESFVRYRIGPDAKPIAYVYYLYPTKDVSVQWFKWNS